MKAEEAARIFYEWAASEGLIPDAPLSPSLVSAGDAAKIQGITETGKATLRSKQIACVGFNEKRKEIQVFLKRTAPERGKFSSTVPGFVDDVSIKYRQGVPSPIGSLPPVPFGGPPYVVRQVPGGSFYTCGSSVSVGNFRDAGTLGCLVRDAAGVLYGLSNNHVTGSCSFAGVGLPILAPGVADVIPGNLPPFTIGFHERTLPLVAGSPDVVNAAANLDAAIFRINDPAHVTSYQQAVYDTPASSADLLAGMEVEKVGRTSGHTRGRVESQLNGAFPVSYQAPSYNFQGQVYFEPLFVIKGLTELFSDNGDSGSLITHVDAQGQRTAVGIVVGGMSDSNAPGGKVTIALPIRPILAQFGVSLVDGHNA